MRVTTAFNKMLGLEGASVTGVSFGPEGIVVALRRRARTLRCPCGYTTRSTYDTRHRRWRHLDLGGQRLWLEADVRRLRCPRCAAVRTEEVPWARPGARHTRAFQDVVAWMAQRADKTTACTLLRTSWEAVARIVATVVAEHIDDARLERLSRIGVDEVSYRKGHRFLTVVADHDAGGVVWAGEGRSSGTLGRFYAELGPERCARLEAVSMDLGQAYKGATDTHAGGARQCADPFHVVKLANEAVDKARRSAWNAERRHGWRDRGPLGRTPADSHARWVKHARWALLKGPATLTDAQLGVLEQLRRDRSVLYRAWQLKEGLRDLYCYPDVEGAARHLEWWLAWACRSQIPAFVTLSRTVRANRARILAAIELGLSNSKLEGIASKVRLINHRGYGHRSAAALIAMIYLCCGGITIELPLR